MREGDHAGLEMNRMDVDKTVAFFQLRGCDSQLRNVKFGSFNCLDKAVRCRKEQFLCLYLIKAVYLKIGLFR